MSLRALVVAMLVLCASCAENAILELDVRLPEASGVAAQYVVIVMRSARESDFDVVWGATDLDGFLLESASRNVTVSVVAQPEDFSDDLLVRALFCSSPRCDALGDDTAGERRLVIEHPFYSLQRTEAAWVLQTVEESVISVPDRISRCEVQGCRSGVTTSYCRTDDGTHFCE